jgi:hypothetical protein
MRAFTPVAARQVCNLRPVRAPVVKRIAKLPPGATVTATVAAQNGNEYAQDALEGATKSSFPGRARPRSVAFRVCRREASRSVCAAAKRRGPCVPRPPSAP